MHVNIHIAEHYGCKFLELLPVANVIKLFMAVSYEFSLKKTRAFVSGNPFQPRLMFGGKARAYPSEAP
jgi:hypothetical protein